MIPLVLLRRQRENPDGQMEAFFERLVVPHRDVV